jgi:hypothetical protein
MSEQTLCACGRPLHYNSPAVRRLVEEMIARMGAEVKVTVGNRSWMVPRHYIALHGFKARELPTLGFPEVSQSK